MLYGLGGDVYSVKKKPESNDLKKYKLVLITLIAYNQGS